MAGQNGGARAPDNNKRLAKLETSIASLALALAANGFDVPEGADPCEVATIVAKDAATNRAKIASLADAIVALHTEAVGDHGGAIETAIKLLGDLAISDEKLAGANAKIASLEEAIGNGASADATAALEDRIDELERAGMAKDARIKELEAGAPVIVQQLEPETAPAAAAEPVERPETARDVGPEYPGLLKSAEIPLIIAGDGGELDVAFSNGEYEIVGLAPVRIEYTDLQQFEGRNVVSPAIHATLANGDTAETLHGFGLMLNGEQIAYCPLLDPIRMQPGEEHRFHKAIFF